MFGIQASSDRTALRDRPARPGIRPQRRAYGAQDWRRVGPLAPDQAETRLVRRARRQALLLMIGSGLVSVASLYGLWTLATHLAQRAS